jgi:hypothetical protein
VLTHLLLLTACGGGDDGLLGSNGGVTPVTPPSTVTALSCLAPRLLAIGHVHTLTYTSTQTSTATGSAALSGTLVIATQVSGPALLDGLSTVRVENTAVSTLGGISSSTRSADYQTLVGQKVLTYRLETLDVATGIVSSLRSNTPAPALDFGLVAGSSSSQSYASTLVSAGVSGQLTSNESDTVQFIGLETLDLPAGRFVATCHFRFTSITSGIGEATDVWLAATLGLPVKKVNTRLAVGNTPGQTRTDLLSSGTVQGATLTP